MVLASSLGKRAMAIMLALIVATPGWAQSAALPQGPTDSAMVNLVRMLVEQGVLSRDKGAALIAQAKAEAAGVASQGGTAVAGAAVAGGAAGTAMAALPPAASGAIRVPYVPESVREAIKEDLKRDVLAQAQAEGWAAPGEAAPEWTRRITLSGDLRIRSQSNLYSRANSDEIFDFATINTLAPFDIVNSPVIPFLNTRQDRWNRMNFRARLNLDVEITPNLTAGLQIATGDNNGPISTNQALSGGFGKKDIWLQKAFIEARPTSWSSLTFGRMPSPFTSTQLMFDEDLAFDGVAFSIDSGKRLGETASVTLRGGAFPLDLGVEGYQVFDQGKRSYPEKWLFSAQLEGNMRVADLVDAKLAVAYHSFSNVQGDLSDPCFLYLGAVECSTDARAPIFLVKGNTLSRLRNIAPDPTLPPTTIQPQPQILGYTFDYDVLDLNLQATFNLSGPINVTVAGNFLRNLSYRQSDICRNGANGEPVNNAAPNQQGTNGFCAATNATKFDGGRDGYLLSVGIGHNKVTKWGEWSAEVGYRYLETDAVPDAFPDSDFHLGGTNARGFTIAGKTGLMPGMTLGARFLSANEISGDPLAIDVLQIDLGVSF